MGPNENILFAFGKKCHFLKLTWIWNSGQTGAAIYWTVIEDLNGVADGGGSISLNISQTNFRKRQFFPKKK